MIKGTVRADSSELSLSWKTNADVALADKPVRNAWNGCRLVGALRHRNGRRYSLAAFVGRIHTSGRIPFFSAF
jgi:hypothetical protein